MPGAHWWPVHGAAPQAGWAAGRGGRCRARRPARPGATGVKEGLVMDIPQAVPTSAQPSCPLPSQHTLARAPHTLCLAGGSLCPGTYGDPSQPSPHRSLATHCGPHLPEVLSNSSAARSTCSAGSKMPVQGSWHQALRGGPHSCWYLPTPLLVCSAEGVGRLPPSQGLLTAHARLNFHLQELPQG